MCCKLAPLSVATVPDKKIRSGLPSRHLTLFHEIKPLEPVLLTYTRFFKACTNTVDDTERTNAIEVVHRRCCENGFGSHPELKKTFEKVRSFPG
jgi:hypothetical protein